METIRVPRTDARFQPCLESRQIAEHFEQMSIDAMVTYDRLREMANGKDIQRGYRYILDTARKIAQADNNVVMGAITGQGLKRLNDKEIVRTGEIDRKFVQRKASRSVKRIQCADTRKLDEQDQMMAMTYTGLFAAVALVSAFRTIKKIQHAATEQSVKALEPAQVLKLFV